MIRETIESAITRPTKKYLRYLGIKNLFGTDRTKQILKVNPTILPHREEAREIRTYVYDYNPQSIEEHEFRSVEPCFQFRQSNRISWINIDGIRKSDVELICTHFEIHPLLIEDILSIQQRPKMDEVENVLFCLLNMLYFNEVKGTVEQEQISIVLGKDFVISFQEDASRDVFNPLREKLKLSNSKIRQRSADYLCYSMLDMIVDNYFTVMEKLGERIEDLEEQVIASTNNRALARISSLRKELIVLKRNIAPVRDLLNGIIRSESDLLDDRTTKYFKDVYDHIMQANDLCENYRDVMVNMQDLYINNVNLRMNEVMKVMAIVTCLLAPATVIGGIFGMNFDRIPYLHHKNGFYIAVFMMLIIPVYMLWVFRKRGWF
ncbi:magnesium/cobalt transporter CorA [Flavihumibacter sp. CACIAM 22H1]|uniref:magnesium/cobalt transporter CorA n=1 Tax=Flavihumibacter sp. CACIAM 22H1 TaxID=1812911 RepID=UPI0007A8DBC0|nr:magnesium/cobalt transporter CorA [Flavihumibacter sp. CACIAM 22H1]KYP15784.1 MAG: magnesium and cobalt transport protein CorA [Flavihumibacter sp. CACIAM 22H1]